MVLKIQNWIFAILLIVTLFNVASGQGSSSATVNLIVPGIWETKQSEEINQKYATLLHANYVHTFPPAWDSGERDLEDVLKATPDLKYSSDTNYDAALKASQNPTNLNAKGEVFRYEKNPSSGAVASYGATDANGLKDDLLNGNKNYNTIYAHSGGARAAVTALLYQGITANTLVLMSPARGPETSDEYNAELSQLLETGKVKKIVVYQSDAPDVDTPFAKELWQGKFKKGDVTGNFEIIPVSPEQLLGKKGNEAHEQMWKTCLNLFLGLPVETVDPSQSTKRSISSSLLKKDFLKSLSSPLLSPLTSDTIVGYSNEGSGGEGQQPTEGSTGPQKPLNIPPYPDYIGGSTKNIWGYNWIYQYPNGCMEPGGDKWVMYSEAYKKEVEDYLAYLSSHGGGESQGGSQPAGVGPLC